MTELKMTSNAKKNDKISNAPRQKGILHDKIFSPRNSLLSDLLETPHLRTVYNIFIVSLIIFFLQSIMNDFMDGKRLNFGLDLISTSFGKIDKVIIIWFEMQLTVFFPYMLLKVWSTCRNLVSSMFLNNIITALVILTYISYLFVLIWFPLALVWKNELPIVSSIIVIFEMIRFSMKSHAFVRTMSPKILRREDSKTSKALNYPSISWYTYFMFAPTIVYKDSYPRAENIRWNIVISNFFEVFVIILYLSFLCNRFLINRWEQFGLDPKVLDLKYFTLSVFGSMLPGQLFLVSNFYLILHCWHNATAELLKFADKQFYLDWWNQSDYGRYYLTWNTIVQDWLYNYIYKDIVGFTKNRKFAAFSVFFISAVFHEIALMFAFRFFYPVLFIFFAVFGVIFKEISKHFNHKIGNIFLWLTLTMGNGLLWNFYSIEYYARKNCILNNDDMLTDIFVPYSWYCKNNMTLSI